MKKLVAVAALSLTMILAGCSESATQTSERITVYNDAGEVAQTYEGNINIQWADEDGIKFKKDGKNYQIISDNVLVEW